VKKNVKLVVKKEMLNVRAYGEDRSDYRRHDIDEIDEVPSSESDEE
jgi:hypothetical protein